MLMERTEPTLVPEWLRCTGNVAGSGSLLQHSDASANSARSRSFRSNGEKDSLRRLDRSSSFDSRSSSISNGSTKHPYSSFSRSHKDRKWDRDKGKPLSDDTWYRDSFESLVSISNHRNESSSLRHSPSSGSRKPGEALPHKVEGSRTGNDGVFKGPSNLSVTQKGVFEKNFPLLGKEEKKSLARTGAGLSSPSHILPYGDTVFLSEKWTSALAEVPVNNEANVTVHSSLPKNVAFSNSLSGVSSTSILNMAETLSQPAVGTREAFQLPDKSQRLEELAIKHSRQLIPVTPSMPKALVPSLGDKLKQRKPTLSSGATAEASRIVHSLSHSSHRANQSHTGQIRHDSTTTSHVGKFLVLKSSRENGTTTSAKNRSSADNDVHDESMDLSSLKAPTIPSTSTVSALGKRTAALSLNSASNAEKRTSQSLVQSRSEFFNLMRKKNSSGLSTSLSDPSSSGLHAKAETLEGTRDLVLENSDHMKCNGDSHLASENRKDSSDSNGFDYTCGSVYPDEEEAAFLRSLGWEENGGEDEGLTEEEINAFYEEYVHKTPTLKLCRGFQPKCSTLAELQSISGSDSTTKTEPGA